MIEQPQALKENRCSHIFFVREWKRITYYSILLHLRSWGEQTAVPEELA